MSNALQEAMTKKMQNEDERMLSMSDISTPDVLDMEDDHDNYVND